MTIPVSENLLGWIIGTYLSVALAMLIVSVLIALWLTLQARAYEKQYEFAKEAQRFLKLPETGEAPAYALYCMSNKINDRLIVYRYIYWYYWRKRDPLMDMKEFVALEKRNGQVSETWARAVDHFLVAATYKDPLIVFGMVLRAVWLPRHRRGDADTLSITTQKALLRTICATHDPDDASMTAT